MARYTGASCRQCRREGMKLFLKGDRCYTDKCAIVKETMLQVNMAKEERKFLTMDYN